MYQAEKIWDKSEIKLFKKLNSPQKIQDYLNSLKFNFETNGETCQSPRRVLKTKKAHCMEGALLAAAILEFHGQPPLVMDLRSVKPHDDDHVVAVFKAFGCFGAISKTNHGVLRYREPVYKTLRELAMSYFHEYFLDNGHKTLREYSDPFDLRHFDKLSWRTSDEELFAIPKYLDRIKHHKMLTQKQIRNLRKADSVEISAGKIIEYKR